jgi:hypothetical protein
VQIPDGENGRCGKSAEDYLRRVLAPMRSYFLDLDDSSARFAL